MTHFVLPFHHNLSAIRQKGESEKGCYKKTKHAKFSEKRTFLTSWNAHGFITNKLLKKKINTNLIHKWYKKIDCGD